MAKSSLVVRAAFISCLLLAAAMVGCAADEGGGGSGGTAGAAGAAGTAGMTGMDACAATAPGPINGVPGCEAAVAGTPVELHNAAMGVLSSAMTCGFGSCHTPGRNAAQLTLLDQMDLKATLVDIASCQAPGIPLVKSGCGNAALAGSWLWLKLVAPADSSGVMVSDPVWGTPVATCDQMSGQPFGIRMPYSGTDMITSEARLGPIRNWICAGAPGPI